MTSFHETLKSIIFEVEKFLNETLKKEKISSSSKDHKQLILDKINQVREEYPQFLPTKSDEAGKSRQDLDKIDDESTRTGGSSNADSAEDPYNDQGIPETPASDSLKDATKSGYLEKKQPKKSLLTTGKLQKRFCVVKGNIFYYYEKEKDKKQKGAFHLNGYEFRPCPDLVKDASKKDLCFELYTTDKRAYQDLKFVAQSKDDFDGWRNAVLLATGSDMIDDNDDEDIYEPIGEDQDLGQPSEPKADDFYSDAIEEEVISPVKVVEPEPELEQDDIYEDTANELDQPESPKVPEQTELEQDEEYTDCETVAPPPVPGRPLPRPPPPPADQKPPEIPGRGGAPSRKPNLPPPPIPLDEDESTSSEPLPPPPPSMELPPIPTEEQKSPKPPAKKRKVLPRDQDFENLYYGLWDCMADKDNELSFKKGDMILIINRDFDDKSWWVGELGGKFGLVPKNYLTNAYTPATA